MIPMLRTRSSATLPLVLSTVATVTTGRAAACPRQRTRGGGAGEPGGSTAGQTSDMSTRSPSIVRKRLVGLRHPVKVVLALEGVALLVEGVQDRAGTLVRPLLLAPVAR